MRGDSDRPHHEDMASLFVIDINNGQSMVHGAHIAGMTREKLMIEFLPVIKYIAREFFVISDPCINMDDLISAGMIGLIDAMEKYDCTHENTFKTYAEFRIRGAMRDELRNLDWVSRTVRNKEAAFKKAKATLERTLLREANEAELAAELGIDVSTLHQWIGEIHTAHLLSIDGFVSINNNGESVDFLEIYAGDTRDMFEDALASENGNFIGETIDALPYQEKVVVSLYYYSELTMKEIGTVMEVTESRISQIHTKAIFHLRSKLRFLADSRTYSNREGGEAMNNAIDDVHSLAATDASTNGTHISGADAKQEGTTRGPRTIHSIESLLPQIRVAIQNGMIAPSQSALSSTFGIGQRKVTQILNMLEAEGVLATRESPKQRRRLADTPPVIPTTNTAQTDAVSLPSIAVCDNPQSLSLDDLIAKLEELIRICGQTGPMGQTIEEAIRQLAVFRDIRLMVNRIP